MNNYYSYKVLKIWILLSILLIFSMIIVGGLTRLTNSGLSITEWELFAGILPPLNMNQWNKYFELYKQIPQYKIINNSITMEEFKIIFYWEYFHRLLGRFIGLFFIIPLIFFTIKRVLNKTLFINFFSIFILICVQGYIGWYMVSSGLVNNTTVSHYRLAIHLFIAFIIISSLYWNYLNIKNNTYKKILHFTKFNYLLKIFFLLVLLQIVLGAFVSGLDAGTIYQTWPLMSLSYFPDDITLSSIYNFLDLSNPSLVQFYHRNLAYIILIYYIFIGLKYLNSKKEKIINKYIIVFLVLLAQVALGIFTLISGLSLYVALLHQITSILLILTLLNLNYYSSN